MDSRKRDIEKTRVRSWRYFARECFCFDGEAARGLARSRVEFTRGFAISSGSEEKQWRLRCLILRVTKSRQLRRLGKNEINL